MEVGSGAHESEAQLEKRFIQILESQGYEYLNTLTQEDDLIANLRKQMEKLNHVALNEGTFTDGEWERFYKEILANKKDRIVEKTKKFQEERRFTFVMDDKSTKNLMIVDDEHLSNNTLQVINQYEEHGGAHEVRYDVTVLVNGLPIVHIGASWGQAPKDLGKDGKSWRRFLRVVISRHNHSQNMVYYPHKTVKAMEITKKVENGEVVLAVTGCLDTLSTKEFAAELEKCAAEAKAIVLDFKDLEFIASSALRILVSVEKRLKPQGGGIALANLNDVVRDVFEVTGLDEVFPIR